MFLVDGRSAPQSTIALVSISPGWRGLFGNWTWTGLLKPPTSVSSALTQILIITLDGADIGWLPGTIRNDAFFLAPLLVDASFQPSAPAPRRRNRLEGYPESELERAGRSEREDTGAQADQVGAPSALGRIRRAACLVVRGRAIQVAGCTIQNAAERETR